MGGYWPVLPETPGASLYPQRLSYPIRPTGRWFQVESCVCSHFDLAQPMHLVSIGLAVSGLLDLNPTQPPSVYFFAWGLGSLGKWYWAGFASGSGVVMCLGSLRQSAASTVLFSKAPAEGSLLKGFIGFGDSALRLKANSHTWFPTGVVVGVLSREVLPG